MKDLDYLTFADSWNEQQMGQPPSEYYFSSTDEEVGNEVHVEPPIPATGGHLPFMITQTATMTITTISPHLTLKRRMKIPPAQWKLMKQIHRM